MWVVVVSTEIYNNAFYFRVHPPPPSLPPLQKCPCMICTPHGLESIRGLDGDSIKKDYLSVPIFSVLPRQHGEQSNDLNMTRYVHHVLGEDEDEEEVASVCVCVGKRGRGGKDAAFDEIYWLLCPYGGTKGGREQEKQTGPCLRLELGGGSAPRRVGISGPSVPRLGRLFLFAASSLPVLVLLKVDECF